MVYMVYDVGFDDDLFDADFWDDFDVSFDSDTIPFLIWTTYVNIATRIP
jgi:hypothetical protein